MKLMMSDDYSPVAGAVPEWVDGQVIILADVLYWGPIKDPSENIRLEKELLEVRERLKNCPEYMPDVKANLKCLRRELKLKIATLPRVEVWRREYKVLGRTTSVIEAREIIKKVSS